MGSKSVSVRAVIARYVTLWPRNTFAVGARPTLGALENGGRGGAGRRFFSCTTASMPNERPVAKQTISLRSLLYHAIQAAELGGLEVRAVRDSGDLGTRSKSICFNPVTLGDQRSHLAMKGTLKQAFPFLTVISEEDDHCLNSVVVELDAANQVAPSCPPLAFRALVPADEVVSVRDVTVWIDPLDGTQEFTDGQYDYVTTMVGIAVKGKPVAGVIHLPFSAGETYWAWNGHGISPSLRSLKAHSREADQRSSQIIRLAMSKNPFRAGTILRFARKAFEDQEFELVPMGGAGYKFVQMLLGNVDAYLHVTRNIKKWDTCAGHGIVSSLHGRVTGLQGEEMDYTAPEDYKQDCSIQTGFIGALRDHDSLLTGCRRAG
ncbi:putative inositol monophosphatase 3 [Hypsibius exemplaris]|uniref:Myo-inositol monophosphatase A3 n=1 Tax=Hypsibius exemplaris TaxID=2072580 RepID=A0A9X6RP77_HYPEX|nr:putative inositol monophosphatase 3 [Hypsibius exemplaris]